VRRRKSIERHARQVVEDIRVMTLFRLRGDPPLELEHYDLYAYEHAWWAAHHANRLTT